MHFDVIEYIIKMNFNERRIYHMQFKSQYLQSVYDTVCKRNPDEPEFLQAVREVLESFEPVVEKRPDIVKAGVIDRIVEPERFIQFRVSWVDDNGKVQVNRGYRVRIRAVSDSIPLSAHPLSSSSALSRSSKTP